MAENSGTIMGLLLIGILIYHFAVESVTGWFLWLSTVVLFVFNLLLFMFKPKTA